LNFSNFHIKTLKIKNPPIIKSQIPKSKSQTDSKLQKPKSKLVFCPWLLLLVSCYKQIVYCIILD